MAWNTVVKLCTAFVVVSVLAFVALMFLKDQMYEILSLVSRMHGLSGTLVFIILFISVSFPMTWGYIVLNIGAGYIFGFWIGLLITICGSNMGALIAFHSCSLLCHDFIIRRIGDNERMRAIMRVIDGPNCFKVIILSRLAPIPFGFQNALYSVVKVRSLTYLIATAIGLLPTQILNAYMGSSLKTMEEVFSGSKENNNSTIIFVVQLLMGVFLVWFVYKKAKAEFDKALVDVEEGCSSSMDSHSFEEIMSMKDYMFPSSCHDDQVMVSPVSPLSAGPLLR